MVLDGMDVSGNVDSGNYKFLAIVIGDESLWLDITSFVYILVTNKE